MEIREQAVLQKGLLRMWVIPSMKIGQYRGAHQEVIGWKWIYSFATFWVDFALHRSINRPFATFQKS